MQINRVVTIIFVALVSCALFACSPPAPPQTQPTLSPQNTAVQPTKIPTAFPPTVAPTFAPSALVSNVPSLQLLEQTPGGFVSAFGWSADNQILTARADDAISQYNASDLKQTNLISTTFAAQIFALAPNGAQVVGIAQDSSVNLWNAADGKLMQTFGGAAQPVGAAFTPDSSMVATFSGDTIAIQLWDTQSGKLLNTLTGFQTAAPIYSAVFAPDNKTMAWVSRGTVQFMDIASGKLGATLQFEDFVGAAQFTPDSQSLVTTSAGTVNNQSVGLVQGWNVVDGKLQQQLTTPQFFSGLSVAPKGTLLATGTGNTIQLWNWKTGGDATSVNTSGQISVLDFSNDGKMLATGDQNGNLALWSVQ